MKAMLLVAHGSRREESNEEIRALTNKLALRLNDSTQLTHCAFLELAQPSIPDGIQQCIDEGATSIIVYPYFLSKGRHVVEDIPSLVETKIVANPAVDIEIANYLGAGDAILDAMVLDASQLLNSRPSPQ